LRAEERNQLEIERGRSLPKRILRSAVETYILKGPRQPKEKPVPSVIDLTPISQATIDYWAAQGYGLQDVQDDPMYQEEILQANEEQIRRGHKPYDPEKFGPKDPSHPYAYTPRYVTFKMRREQNFECFVTGWHEDDWILNKQSGEIRKVGRLTRDHTTAATFGGETSAANIKMVCALVNRKKGHKKITYEELREHITQYWERLAPVEGPVDDLTVGQLREMGVTHITIQAQDEARNRAGLVRRWRERMMKAIPF
jgi:hypothetical protein